MIIYFKLILTLFIFLSFSIDNSVYPAAKQNSQIDIAGEYSAGNILGFTKHLISNKEFYRAFAELKRLNSYYPGYIKKDNLFATELFLLYKGGRYSEVINIEFDSTSPDTKLIHSVFKTDAYIEIRDFIKADALVSVSGAFDIDKDIEFYLYKRTVLSYLLLNRIDDTRRLIENRKIDFVNNLNDRDFIDFIELTERCFGSLKKPYTAMALGAVPGMGYVYADQASTGIIAFLLVSALSAFTYYSFKTDNKPIGVFVGTAAAFFYGGSVVGGYLSAKKYNDAAMTDLKDSLSQRMYLEEDREEIYNNYGIGNVGK